MTVPNLFLVGAAKSGTTSMENYLSEHPEIFFSPESEVHHFGKDLDIKYRVADRTEYLQLFADAGDAVAVGEKSIGYLFSKTAAAEIYEFNPNAKIVILLRNPVDMMFSLHRQFVRSSNEDIVDFAEALQAQSDRHHGKRIPHTAHKPEMLQYFNVVDYAPQVKRYLEVFGDQCLVLLFDDLVRDPAGTYRAVLEHVGADPDFAPEFEVHNQTIDLPSVALRRLMAKVPWLTKAMRNVMPPRYRRKLRRASAVVQKQPDRKLDPVLRRDLLCRFETQIDALGALIDRDLSGWQS
ncbi:MAG: sulfotransferase [Acidimicrobiia bacterium]|nr:sulfotransferase [Acidimicrobiia bacterium]